jgi:hypothetical protein
MSSGSVAPTLPAYFGKNAADVPPAACREYEPLVYEVWMLVQATRSLDGLPQNISPEQRPLKNAWLETFALHFRNLAEFLWPNRVTKTGKRRSPKPSDAVVGSFTSGWTPPEPPGLNDFDRARWQRDRPPHDATPHGH